MGNVREYYRRKPIVRKCTIMTKKEITLGELAAELGGELTAGHNLKIKNICDIDRAGEGDLSFIFNKKSESLLEKTKASACVVPKAVKKSPIPVIKCQNPNIAFKKAVEIILPEKLGWLRGIHKTASIGEGARLGENVAVGAHTVIAGGSEIGTGSVIYSNVTIHENVKIGERVIIQSGCVIGGDGFGYERTEKGYEKIPHIGGVVIEDDVELGACVAIDRAKVANTRIGSGTKIDNLVQIAHNVIIGKNCIIVAQCGISGSVKLGNNVILGGQVGLVDHIEIGDNSMIAAQSGVSKSVPPNTILFGSPARPIRNQKKSIVLFDKLPEIYKRLKALEEKFGPK